MVTGDPGAFYGRDLAYVHDAAFGDLARMAAALLIDRLARAGLDGGRVVDLGCGSGITAQALTAAGYDVLGIDVSEELLAIARRRAPRAEFRRALLIDAPLPPCVGVAAIGEALSYARDPRADRAALAQLFVRVHSAIAPGGIVVLDIAAPGREPEGVRRTWYEGPDWTICLEASEDDFQHVLRRQITVFRLAGELYRRTDEIHRLRLHDPHAVSEDLRSAGLRPVPLAGYGEDHRLGHGHAAFLATRPR